MRIISSDNMESYPYEQVILKVEKLDPFHKCLAIYNLNNEKISSVGIFGNDGEAIKALWDLTEEFSKENPYYRV